MFYLKYTVPEFGHLISIKLSYTVLISLALLCQSQESDSSETSVRGPRIKHVCRRAAVALGRNRAVFPDDMPTLSALPWEEREKILSSMGNDGEIRVKRARPLLNICNEV